jgi:hypothetical protein
MENNENNNNNENNENNENFDINNINNINFDQINENEYVFSFPLYNHLNIYESIKNILENIRNNNIITNNLFNNIENESLQLNIEFDVYEEDNNEEYEDDSNNYFKNCKEINDLICKPIKIKKNDILLNESCLICYDKYKEIVKKESNSDSDDSTPATMLGIKRKANCK